MPIGCVRPCAPTARRVLPRLPQRNPHAVVTVPFVTLDRAAVVFPVRFDAGGQAIQTTTREVSVEGVFVRSLQPPQDGSLISLRLYLPGNAEPDDVRGRVRGVRSEPDSGFWAEFIEPPEDVLERIKQILGRRP